jgi:predicted nucleic acid-binding protein
VKTTLIDTGPLVAFLNRRDQHHPWAVDTLSTLAPPLLTCEAVLSEAAYLVSGVPSGREAIMELVVRGVVRPVFRLEEQAAAVKTLLERYAGVSMDLADACLVRMADVADDPVVVTVDTDFRDVYRRNARNVIPTILPVSTRTIRRGSARRRKPSP